LSKSPQPQSELRRDLQLALYALGAAHALGLTRVGLRLVYLKTGQTVDLPASEPLKESALEAGTRVAEGVRRGEFPALPQLRRCSLCPYRLACPEAW